jgi:hypothetical protein
MEYKKPTRSELIDLLEAHPNLLINENGDFVTDDGYNVSVWRYCENYDIYKTICFAPSQDVEPCFETNRRCSMFEHRKIPGEDFDYDY